MLRASIVAVCLCGLVSAPACRNETHRSGVVASASASAGAPPAAALVHFVIEAPSSKLTLHMDSPLEKISGEAPGAVEGELEVDLNDITRSSGLVKVSLERLVLYQEKRSDEKHDYSARQKNDAENKDAREWLQLEAREGEIAAEQAERNRFPQFRIERLEKASASSVAALSGATREVGATARGELLLHGRRNKKSVNVALRFEYSGDQLQSLSARTSEPFKIALEDYDIHPRSKAGKMLKTIGEALAGPLGKKVAEEASIELEFTARPK
ncbi:MAG TPA: hypothetical protein VG937_33715 [Polyangiaceae bacterium]|nr:hypothetical protein [Polyangiaceae bacterium]